MLQEVSFEELKKLKGCSSETKHFGHFVGTVKIHLRGEFSSI